MKKQKGFILPILLFISVVVGIGLLIWKNPQLITKQKSSITATPAFLPSPSPESNLTGGWKTYRNEKYGFEFKYPSDLILNEYSNSVTLFSCIYKFLQVCLRGILHALPGYLLIYYQYRNMLRTFHHYHQN